MKFEEGIWADSEVNREHELYVSIIEESLKEYVEKGRLPEDIALAILQKVESYSKTFDSESEARHQAVSFFEMQVMPIIYEFDELLKGEADLATQQGNLSIRKESLEGKSKDYYKNKISNLEESMKWIDSNESDILKQREKLRRDILD